MKNNYNYIILGAGASGLLLAYRMAKDVFFKDKHILIIDKDADKKNDRTWCFWEENNGEWDAILTKQWSNVFFGSQSFSKTIAIESYTYKMLRSEVFYKSLWSVISKHSNITFVNAEVLSFEDKMHDRVEVKTKDDIFYCEKLFNSIPNPLQYTTQNEYPVLNQHFLGWFVKTESDVFDATAATFMDFTVPQNGNTRFMYVLPVDKQNALFEYTLFSEHLLPKSEYETAIKTYLQEKGIESYEILEKEYGNIPMTVYKFNKHNIKNILHIGTVGGWTKASTGYTFKNTCKKTVQLVEFLKTDKDLTKFHRNSKFWFYDLIFLDVLYNYNNEGAALFASMFKKANIKTIFKFLDEESSLFQDLKIILSVPTKRFLQSFFKRLF